MKKSFLIKKLAAVMVSLIAGMVISLAAGWIFSKGLLFDFKIYSPYVIKIYLKENINNIMLGGMICAAAVFAMLERRYLIAVWDKITHRMSKTASFRLLLILIVILMFAIVYVAYIFGGKYLLFTDAGMDTIYQFYPMYVHLVNEIREGTLSLWNFDWGLGCDTLTRQEWIMDPCAWMTVGSGLLFGMRSIRHVLLIAQFIKVMVCALVCFEFLGFYGFSPKSRFTAACLFSFNGWLMLWGQHYYFGMACVYLIILLWTIERLLCAYRLKYNMTKYHLAVGIIVAFIFIYSVYFGYMIVISAAVYTILRMLYLGYEENEDKALKKSYICLKLWRELWLVMVTVVIGILCASVMIIPYADIVLNVSTRVEGSFFDRMGKYAAALYGGDYYKVLIGRTISNNIFGITALDQKYYEFPQLAFSSVSLLVIPQAIWFGIIKPAKNLRINKNLHGDRQSYIKNIRRLIIKALAAALAVIALTWPFAGAIFNIGIGESLVEDIPAMRFTFVLMPLMALIYAYFVDECLDKFRINIVLLIFGITVVYAVSYYAFWNYRIHYRWVNGALVTVNMVFGVVLAVLMALRYLKSDRLKAPGFIKKLSASALSGAAILCIIGSACFDGYITNEKRYTYDNKTECMAEDFHGSATIKALDKIKNIDDSFYRVEKIYHDFSNAGDSLVQGYSPLSMYCSTMSGYLKKFYEEIYPSAEYKYPSTDTEFSEYDSAFAMTNVKYIISIFPLNYQYLELVSEADGVYIYRNTHAGSIGIIYNECMSYTDFENLLNEDKKAAAANILLLPDTEVPKTREFLGEAADVHDGNVYYTLPDRSSYFTRLNDSHITGNIYVKSDAMLMLSVPYRKGWNIYVDGVKQETVNAGYGFMAVAVSQGEHEITVKYENKLYAAGAAASLAGVLLMTVWLVALRKQLW